MKRRPNNALTPNTVLNPFAGREPVFHVWRLDSELDELVIMRETTAIIKESDDDGDNK